MTSRTRTVLRAPFLSLPAKMAMPGKRLDNGLRNP